MIAPEQKARVTYDNILRLVDDPDVRDPIKYLRQREINHFQRFGEALHTLSNRKNKVPAENKSAGILSFIFFFNRSQKIESLKEHFPYFTIGKPSGLDIFDLIESNLLHALCGGLLL